MKLTNTLLALGLAALPASALADDSTSAAAAGRSDDAAALVQKLGDKEYKVRRDAYKQLEKLGSAARPALEAAAKSDDAEVRWNASRLLDRLDDQGGGLKERAGSSNRDGNDDNDTQDDTPRPRRAGRNGLPPDLQQQMRELEQRMQEFEKEFQRDGFGFQGSWPFGGTGGGDPFHRFGQSFGQFPGEGGELDLQPGSSFSRSSDVNGRKESFSLTIDQDGHVTAEQQKDGKTTKVEADSIEAFKREHPEMLHRGPLTIAIHPFGWKGPKEPGSTDAPRVVIPTPPQPDTATVTPKKKNKVKAPKPETPDQAQAGAQREAAPEPKATESTPKPRLGVELAPVASEVADYLDLDGDAFQIVRVMEGMPAAKKGLKPRDILLEVNGQPIHAFDDVVKALDGADPNTVKVVVLRKGQRKEL
jgi:PDZ domain-containing protein/HEAT repeat protein